MKKNHRFFNIPRTLSCLGVAAASLGASSVASAAVLFTTQQDFAQFGDWWPQDGVGTAITSTTYYSDNSAVNGIGNTTAAGGAGTVGSVQLTVQNWGNPNGGSPQIHWTDPSLADMAPGSSWATGLTASSGTISFDLYAPVALTGSYAQFGFSLSAWDGSWTQTSWNNYMSGSYTTFTGADDNTWRHYEVAYTTPATVGLQGFKLPFQMNVDGVDAGKMIYVDNIQVTAIPEPSSVLLLGFCGMGMVLRRRR